VIRKFDQYMFRRDLQYECETIEQCVAELKLKAKTYNYGILEESLIRDQICLRTLDLTGNAKLLYNGHLDSEEQYPFSKPAKSRNAR